MKRSDFHRILNELQNGGKASLVFTVDGQQYQRVFIPDDRLILLGGGHVSLALAKMAAMLDFSVVVVDDRSAFANTKRFPMAKQVLCDRFEEAIDALKIRESDYVCVLTRGHQWDTVCVRKILSGDVMPYYFGMIGSHRRVSGMREGLIADGFDAARIGHLHAPIGIKIGGITPAEIAVSICAEMVQCRRQMPITLAPDELSQKNTDTDVIGYLANGEDNRAILLVLSSSGSTPVKSGSLMAVNALGQGFGTIGGGCSEAAAINCARRIIGTGERRVIDIDMSDEVAAENGMVCGGMMRILIEDMTE